MHAYPAWNASGLWLPQKFTGTWVAPNSWHVDDIAFFTLYTQYILCLNQSYHNIQSWVASGTAICRHASQNAIDIVEYSGQVYQEGGILCITSQGKAHIGLYIGLYIHASEHSISNTTEHLSAPSVSQYQARSDVIIICSSVATISCTLCTYHVSR